MTVNEDCHCCWTQSTGKRMPVSSKSRDDGDDDAGDQMLSCCRKPDRFCLIPFPCLIVAAVLSSTGHHFSSLCRRSLTFDSGRQ